MSEVILTRLGRTRTEAFRYRSGNRVRYRYREKGRGRGRTVVPPISTTKADSLAMSDWRDARNAAPLIELVGPEELCNHRDRNVIRNQVD